MRIKSSLAATALWLGMLVVPAAFADLRTIDAETQASIKLAERFYEDILVYQDLNNFSKYIGDTYIQHAPAYGDGPAAMIAAVARELTADPGVDVALYRTIAEGPYAAIHSVWTASTGE